MDSSTATYLLPHFLSQLHALKTGVQKSLVLVALDETAMAICRKLHAPELCHLLDVSSLQSQEQHDYYIDLGAHFDAVQAAAVPCNPSMLMTSSLTCRMEEDGAHSGCAARGPFRLLLRHGHCADTQADFCMHPCPQVDCNAVPKKPFAVE